LLLAQIVLRYSFDNNGTGPARLHVFSVFRLFSSPQCVLLLRSSPAFFAMVLTHNGTGRARLHSYSAGPDVWISGIASFWRKLCAFCFWCGYTISTPRFTTNQSFDAGSLTVANVIRPLCAKEDMVLWLREVSVGRKSPHISSNNMNTLLKWPPLACVSMCLSGSSFFLAR